MCPHHLVRTSATARITLKASGDGLAELFVIGSTDPILHIESIALEWIVRLCLMRTNNALQSAPNISSVDPQRSPPQPSMASPVPNGAGQKYREVASVPNIDDVRSCAGDAFGAGEDTGVRGVAKTPFNQRSLS